MKAVFKEKEVMDKKKKSSNGQSKAKKKILIGYIM